jgi:ElaB/YqjD/DUF883 family membrane-anchored ribosome-binding protein
MSSYGVREGTGAGEWIMAAVKRNPEGLLLLAAGCALLMRNGSGHQSRPSYAEGQYRGSREDSISGVRERVGEAARRASEYVAETTDKMSEAARSYASSAADYADEAQRTATERSRQMAERARDTADYVVREQPWALALTGLLAGAAVAAAFPPTPVERRTLGELGERLRSAAGRMGEQVVEAGRQAGERLSEVAEERGLTKEGLKEAARDVGGTFSSALTGEEANSAQASNRKQADVGSSAGTRQGQSGTATTHSNRAGSGRSSGHTPSGGGSR